MLERRSLFLQGYKLRMMYYLVNDTGVLGKRKSE